MDSDTQTSTSFPDLYLNQCDPDIQGSVFFESPDFLICVINHKGKIIKAGAGFAAMMEVSAKNLKGLNLDKLLTGKSFKKLLSSLGSEKCSKQNLKAFKPSGKKIYLTSSATKVEDFYLINFTDITKQKKLAKKHKRQEEMLIQQSKMAAIGEMLGVIAHQWKQPLNALSIIAQTIGDDFDHDELDQKAVEEHINSIGEQIKFMNATVDDFRRFFLPQKEPQNFCIKESIQKTLSIIDPQLRVFNVAAVLKTPDIEAQVAGYKNEFMQVMLNLVANSKDAVIQRRKTDPAFAAEKGLVEITVTVKDNHCNITISDNGGGVEPKVLKKLFSPYFTTKNENGTGIGLYLSKTIIEDKMHGQIKAGTVGKNAVFTIKLPLTDELLKKPSACKGVRAM